MCMEAVYDMKELAKFKSGVMFRKGENLRFKLDVNLLVSLKNF